MAEGKNIEIKIAATGGDQAAAEIKKVDKATENLSGSGTGMGLKALTSEANKVTAAGVKMGTGMQNVGYQVQDLAVQIGSGQSAFRALGQQMPQLLSGFGPWGIALGTISAVAIPLAGTILNLAQATEESTAATMDAIDATVKMAREQELAGSLETEALQRKNALTETLRQITTAQYAYNESLQEQLGILTETQATENEIAAAKGQLEIDQAEGDPVKQEEVKNRVRKEAQARELAQLDARRKAGGELIDRKGAQELEVGEAGTAEAASLRTRADAAGEAALEKEQLADLKKATAEDKTTAAEGSKGAAAAALKRDAAKLREEYLQATESAKALRAEEKDLTGQADTVDSTTKAEVERLRAEANKLFDEVEKLKREAEKKQEIFGIRDQQGDLREGRIRTQTDQKAAEAQARADEKAASEAEAQARTASRDQGRNNSAAAKAGNDASRLLPKDVSAAFRKQVERVTAGLQDGDQGGELDELVKLMSILADATQKRDASRSTQIANLAAKVEVLSGQIKQSRTGQ